VDLVGLEIEDGAQDIVVAHVTGELDIVGASSTGDAISEAVPTSARALVVDLTRLEFIDSSGIAMMFSLARKLSGRRQELRVVARAGAPVQRVLELVEFDRAAPIYETVEDAVAELSRD
jgi:anti-sigma B factor antagonist